MFTFDTERLNKLEALRAEGINPYPTGKLPNLSAAQALALGEGKETTESLAELGQDFRFAGRLMFKNDMGKAGFARALDRTGRLQVYVKKDLVGEAGFAVWKKLDLGDQIEVEGGLMRTRTGELTLQATSIRLVGKCIRSLPDKWHGMEDAELRRRQRYVDLFVNDGARETFVKRSRIVRYIRTFFEERGFLEVETPMMHAIPGGATARPFQTHHNALDMELFLRVAPELFLKRLIVGGLERVFEVNRNFRNEGLDATHNPEFTMLEFYWAYAQWEQLADLTEELLHGLTTEVCGGENIQYQGREISFARPFRRAGYDELVAEAAGIALADVRNIEKLRAFIGDGAPKSLGACWERIFDEHIEKTLVNPTFVTRFPIEISPLARRNDAEPDLADRFELFVAGREIANAFNELADPVDQAQRFEAQVSAKDAGNEEAMHFDADYVEALCYGMPPTAGEGIGIDRLVMLLTDSLSIRDVILFPTLRNKA
ncbi:lysine--tRNA ligase [Deltaproteobacteria bacterium]|nr:lysine--tRNA ligase [Deltaproteobacteria bacterium]